jgi:polysaccharide export outer membrane protein
LAGTLAFAALAAARGTAKYRRAVPLIQPFGAAQANAAGTKAEPLATLPPEYTIGEQDELNIDVWQERELSVQVVVRPDGKINMPLVGELYVIGMTPPQLQEELTKRLGPILTVPKVTVSVRAINSRRVYVIGAVAHPGVFPINSTMTVLQLLAQAGGLSVMANSKKIYVLRNENGRQSRYPFNYNDVIKGLRNDQNIILHPGDTVVVP